MHASRVWQVRHAVREMASIVDFAREVPNVSDAYSSVLVDKLNNPLPLVVTRPKQSLKQRLRRASLVGGNVRFAFTGEQGAREMACDIHA